MKLIDQSVIDMLHEKYPEALSCLSLEGVDEEELQKEWKFLQKNLDDYVDFMPEEIIYPNVDEYPFKKICKLCIVFHKRKAIFVKPAINDFKTEIQDGIKNGLKLGKTIAIAIADDLESFDEMEKLKYGFSIEREEWRNHSSKSLTIYNGHYTQLRGAVKYVLDRDKLKSKINTINRRILNESEKGEA